MCGIAGVIDFGCRSDKKELLAAMAAMLLHRGPDACGFFQRGPAALVHTRLSVIDLHTGDQPIPNEDRTIWVVFNGEIFNYPELREELIELGHRFSTASDTEVLVHLYEEFGTDFLCRLNGQFAFAIWDTLRETLMLARDRIGIRPLFYHYIGQRFVFGSEIKAIFTDATIPRVLNYQAVSDVFTCWSPVGEDTSFKGVHQVSPGNYLIFSKNGIEKKCYWQLSYDRIEEKERGVSCWASELSALLRDSVKLRLRADVPVGTYLSGGLDSTSITSLVKNNFDNRLRTFSIGFTDREFDETPWQKKAVELLETDHTYATCSYDDIGEAFQDVIWYAEAPMLRTAAAPLFLLSKKVRESGFKVVLTGEGADELFAGYNIFKADKIRRFWSRFPESRIRPLLLKRIYPYVFKDENSKAGLFLRRFFKNNLMDLANPVYSHMIRWENTGWLRSFFSRNFKSEINEGENFFERIKILFPKNFMEWDPLSRAQFIESKIFLSNYLLSSQGDRMAMAHSVEGRYPFLDHRVVEFAAKIPPNIRMNGLTEKYVLKQAVKEIIPREILCRTKQPFRAPIGRSFWGKEGTFPYLDNLLSERNIMKTGCFESSRVMGLLKKWRNLKGRLTSERENMALTGIISVMMLDHLYIRDFPGILKEKAINLVRETGNNNDMV